LQRNRSLEVEVEILESELGSVLHADGRLVAVLDLKADGFALLNGTERDRLVEGFAASFGLLARSRSVVKRAGWVVEVTTGSVTSLERDRRRRARGPVQQTGSYARLLGEVDHALPERRAHLFLASGVLGGSFDSLSEDLIKEAKTVADALEGAGHLRPELVDAEGLRSVLGELCTPAESPNVLRSVTASRFDRVEGAMGNAVAWWVAEWPRHDVSAEALSSVLLGDGSRRMAIVAEPVETQTALRRTQVASTKGAADEELRRRGGFLVDRRRTAQADHRAVREEELVAGHHGLRFAGFLSVHTPDRVRLDEEVRSTELAAVQAGLVLRRLQGDHHRGRLATFPLGRGLS
jgi:hypothetical protein